MNQLSTLSFHIFQIAVLLMAAGCFVAALSFFLEMARRAVMRAGCLGNFISWAAQQKDEHGGYRLWWVRWNK